MVQASGSWAKSSSLSGAGSGGSPVDPVVAPDELDGSVSVVALAVFALVVSDAAPVELEPDDELVDVDPGVALVCACESLDELEPLSLVAAGGPGSLKQAVITSAPAMSEVAHAPTVRHRIRAN